MTMLEKAIKAVNKAGFYLNLSESRSGKWRWSALALGDNREVDSEGVALYTREIAFADTPDAALAELIEKVEGRKTVKTAEEKAFDMFG